MTVVEALKRIVRSSNFKLKDAPFVSKIVVAEESCLECFIRSSDSELSIRSLESS